MELDRMNINGPVTEGFAQLNYHMRDEHKDIRERVTTGDCQGLSEEYESQINEDMEDINDGPVEEVQVQVQAHPQAVLLGGRQPLRGPLVRWEKFLPVRTFKVLLVENDDSTCYIVSALLRNCGYEVTAVTNGFDAWKILIDLTNHIDLVLTEVVMPSLSGIGLLCKIMSHKSFKNIPVIMMSSHDSMSLVFKCLSNGATDFLVKPIRKNELKNLWQHVWRKCQSSCGSGSECGIQTKKSRSTRSAEDSDNDSGSNDEDGFRSIHLDVRDGNDNGSSTQSSWTKRAVEAYTPKPISPDDQLPNPSERPGVTHSSPQTRCNNWVPVTATSECKEQDAELGHSLDNDLTSTDLVLGYSKIPYFQLEDRRETVLINEDGTKISKFADINSKKDAEERLMEFNSEKQSFQSRNLATDLVGCATTNSHTRMKTVVFEIPYRLSKVCDKYTDIYGDHAMPSLELSLKRTRDTGDTETSAYDQNVFSHSYFSAFSRYSTASTTNETPAGNVGSSSPLHSNSKARNAGPLQNFQSNSDSTPPNQRSDGSSNNNDMGSSTNNIFAKAATSIDKPAVRSTVEHIHNIGAFHQVQNGYTSPCQPAVQNVADAAIANKVLPQQKGNNQQVQVEHYHHHVRGMTKKPDRDDLTSNNMAEIPLRRLSDVLSAPGEGNAGNHSWNGSASASNHGSKAQDEKNTLNARVTNMESDSTITVRGGAGGGIGYGSRSGVDHSRFAQREATLNKFRQKRKDRCFEKKVRYHSRKKLAEQRPRVRGQFVQQVVYEKRGNGTHC